MDSAATVESQQLLDRLRAGDQRARREFLEQICGRSTGAAIAAATTAVSPPGK